MNGKIDLTKLKPNVTYWLCPFEPTNTQKKNPHQMNPDKKYVDEFTTPGEPEPEAEAPKEKQKEPITVDDSEEEDNTAPEEEEKKETKGFTKPKRKVWRVAKESYWF